LRFYPKDKTMAKADKSNEEAKKDEVSTLIDVDGAKHATDLAPPVPGWYTYKLKTLDVYAAAINGKYCRVQTLGGGHMAVEVEGLDPYISEESCDVCLLIAEKSAWTGRLVRRYTKADGTEEYR